MVKLTPFVLIPALYVSSIEASHRTPRLRQRHLVTTRAFGNPCTGSWSNDFDPKDEGIECPETPRSGGLVCDLDPATDPDTPTTSTNIKFFYGVENNDTSTEWLPILEEKIFALVTEELSWCYEDAQLEREGRRLTARDSPEVQRARRLGVVRMTSSPDDKIREDLVCPNDMVNEAAECFVVEGGMTIIAREGDDVSYTIEDQILPLIRSAMENDELLGDDIPTVIKVTYLGESEDDFTITNRGGLFTLEPSAAPTAEDDDDTSFVALITAASSLLLLLLLLCLRQNRKVQTAAEAEKDRGAILVEEDVEDDRFYGIPGTGDPPGSFHHLHYHYTRPGQRYLSTNCETCLETKFNTYCQPIEAEEEPYESTLGAPTEGIDVHKCKSSRCPNCRKGGNNVFFVPVDGATLLEESRSDDEEDDYDDNYSEQPRVCVL